MSSTWDSGGGFGGGGGGISGVDGGKGGFDTSSGGGGGRSLGGGNGGCGKGDPGASEAKKWKKTVSYMKLRWKMKWNGQPIYIRLWDFK